jgi:hypothetical protein
MVTPRMTRIGKLLVVALVLGAVTLLAAACGAPATPAADPTPEAMPEEMEGMEGMDMGDAPVVPAGMAYLDGQEIRFIHTEVSDPDVGKVLSEMMDSPVIVVPSLAQAPEEMLAKVYVFTNGVEGMGPLGFQPDVFDNPPGSAGYSPLRSIVLVTWADGVEARELKSLAEVTEAEGKGELSMEEPGVVVNMPFIVWPGGER